MREQYFNTLYDYALKYTKRDSKIWRTKCEKLKSPREKREELLRRIKEIEGIRQKRSGERIRSVNTVELAGVRKDDMHPMKPRSTTKDNDDPSKWSLRKRMFFLMKQKAEETRLKNEETKHQKQEKIKHNSEREPAEDTGWNFR